MNDTIAGLVGFAIALAIVAIISISLIKGCEAEREDNQFTQSEQHVSLRKSYKQKESTRILATLDRKFKVNEQDWVSFSGRDWFLNKEMSDFVEIGQKYYFYVNDNTLIAIEKYTNE